MATAAKAYTPKPHHLPGCETLINRASFSPERPGEIELQNGAVHALPIGTRQIYMQRRMCGDYYCLIKGKKDSTAIGETADAAFLNAFAKAA